MNRISRCVIAVIIMVLSAASSPGIAQRPQAARGDWPWWRGPNFDGTAEEGQTPVTEWSSTANVAWSAPIPGRGHSSPVVVGNRVFLTSADDAAQKQWVLCFDRQTGQQVWRREVNQGGFPRRIHRKNSHASPTVACDGEFVFATFFHSDAIHAVALDLDGDIQWQRSVAAFTPQQYKHGYGASPLVYGNNVIIVGDYDGDAFLVAIARKSGETAWTARRPGKISYASPVVAHVAGRDQLLISGCDVVASYDPQGGKLLWETPATTMATVGTIVWDGDLVFAAGGYPKGETACVRGDGSGLVWKNSQTIYEQSMLAHDGYVYALNDNGIAYCWKAETGEELWRERLGGPICASPTLANGAIYATNERGTTFVFKATPESFELIATNQLGSETYASPVICRNQVFMRVADGSGDQRQETLYCIEDRATTR